MAKRIPKRLSPLETCYPWQGRWVADDARWKFGLWGRQEGKDYSSAMEGVTDIVESAARGEKKKWIIVGPSERQSLNSLDQWKDIAAAYDFVIASALEERQGGSETLLKSSTITFPNGSSVMAVPGRPDTVRGLSGNVLFTEFAFFEDPDATWRASLPSISGQMRGGIKKVRIITTPNGIGNKAHDIWSKNYQVPGAQWSCHRVDIYDAVKEGLPFNIEEFKAAMDDPEGWAQEFEIQFMDTASVLLPYELIATCESPEARENCPAEFWQTAAPFQIDMGIDFGRKKDLTVALSGGALGDVGQIMEVLCLEKISTPDQVAMLRPRILRCRRVCLDYTGPGVGLGDYLVKEFGEWNPDKHLYGKIELVTFSNTIKVDIFSKLRMAFQSRTLRVPISRVFREDLHSMCRVSTATGQITYKAPHTADGHADRCTALALWNRARSFEGYSGSFYLFTDTQASRALQDRRQRTLA